MTKERSGEWLLVCVLAGALLSGCGGGTSTGVAGESAAPSNPAGSGGTANTVGTGTATLSWTAPAENVDGTAATNLAGYRIYHGTSPDALTSVIQVPNPGVSLYVVESLSAGVHYFAISAYNSAGVESDRSVIGSKSIL